MSVRDAIIDRIPFSWEVILRKHRCISSFVNQMYEQNIPKEYRNKYYHRKSMSIILQILRNRQITKCFDIKHSKEGQAFWEDIDLEIKELEELWK